MKRTFFPALIAIPIFVAGLNSFVKPGDPPAKKEPAKGAESPLVTAPQRSQAAQSKCSVAPSPSESNETAAQALQEEISYLKANFANMRPNLAYHLEDETANKYLQINLLAPVRKAFTGSSDIKEFSRCPSGYDMVFMKDDAEPETRGNGIVCRAVGCSRVPQFAFRYDISSKTIAVRISTKGDYTSLSEYITLRKQLDS